MIKTIQILGTLLAAAAGPYVFLMFVLVVGLGITIYDTYFFREAIPSVPGYRLQQGKPMRVSRKG